MLLVFVCIHTEAGWDGRDGNVVNSVNQTRSALEVSSAKMEAGWRQPTDSTVAHGWLSPLDAGAWCVPLVLAWSLAASISSAGDLQQDCIWQYVSQTLGESFLI